MTENVVELFKAPAEVAPVQRVAPVVEAPAPLPLWVRSGRAVKAAATHERTRTAGRVAARHTLYVTGGARIISRRTWDGRTAARYERMIRAAEAAGQMEEAKEWEERGRQFRAERHQRRMEMLAAPQRLAKATAISAGWGVGSLLGIGVALAVAESDPSETLTPILATVDFIHWLSIIVGVVWGPFLAVAPWLALLGLWDVGRRRQAAPQWALPAKQRSTEGEPITPSIVVKAMRDLGISTLRKAILEMEDAGAAMLSTIAIAGCGVELDVALPSGVSTEEIQSRRRKLAENLNRHEHEVFITIPPQPRTVRLWIADSGALDEPIGASPLVLDEEMTADYYTGRAPWGQNLRGDAVSVSLKQNHLLITGLSNQGKTAALRALALWLALDETVDFYIADLKGLGDWRPFDGLARVLVQGPTDEHVAQATDLVEWAVDEMQKRIAWAEESGSKDGVTREMARTDERFRPIVVIVDEAQVAYGCGAKGPDGLPYGGSKATSRYFMAVKRIHDQGRAVNVTLWEGTQDPTDQNLPKRSREGNQFRASLVVGTEAQAKMALGEAPVDAGAAPHKLRRGLDKGTLVVAGEGIEMEAGQASVTVRTHYIDGDGADQMAARAKARRVDVATVHQLEAVEPVDHLADLAAVVGREKRVRTTEVLHRLKSRNHAVYEHWNGSRLKALLVEHGEEPGTYDGYPVVRLESVERALERRAKEIAEAQ
ncbi:FtsK/SpoIIIE domain-containing protein [Streptomyces melanosporofaciens]